MSSLQDFGDAGPQVHGLSPMASAFRRFAASRNVAKRNFTSNSIVSEKRCQVRKKLSELFVRNIGPKRF